MFDRLFAKKNAPLTGAPQVRRQKTYSAQSGYVYQYFYEGQRPFQRDRERGTEFVFDVCADRKTSHPVSVFVSQQALERWQTEHGRILSSTERYAIAKMALFRAFDEREKPESMNHPIHVRAVEAEAILTTLDID